MDLAGWDAAKHNWQHPVGGPRSLAAYRRLLQPKDGTLASPDGMLGWNSTSPFPCWRPKVCNQREMERLLRNAPQGNKSCSEWLQAHRCYDLPDPLEREPGRQPKSLLKVACGRLVSRDECACQPCFTECRRSAVCSRWSGDPVSLPAAPSRGSFGYALMVVHSSASANAEGGARHWADRYVIGAFKVVLTLKAVQTAYPIVLLTNLTASSTLQPFREQGVQIQAPPLVVQPRKTSKACEFNGVLCRRNLRTCASSPQAAAPSPRGAIVPTVVEALLSPPFTAACRYAKLGFFALIQFDKIIALDTARSGSPACCTLAAWTLAHRTLIMSPRLQDIIVRQNLDHLFALPTPAAMLDPMQANRGVMQGLEGGFTTRLGGPPVFPWNSGVLLLTPGKALHARILSRIDELPSHDGGDQGFLASFFAAEGIPWHELPRRYNLAFHPQPDEIRNAFAWHALHGVERTFLADPHARAVLCNLSAACHRAGVCAPPRCMQPAAGRRRGRIRRDRAFWARRRREQLESRDQSKLFHTSPQVQLAAQAGKGQPAARAKPSARAATTYSGLQDSRVPLS